MPEVMPCPFCGMKYNEKAVMLVLEPCDTDGYFVQCLDCGACGPVGYPEEYDHYDSDAVQKAEEEAKAKALDLWANIKPSALPWTHEPPKMAGWYWWRSGPGQNATTIRVHEYIKAVLLGETCDQEEKVIGYWDQNGTFRTDIDRGEWAGPIAPPID